MNNAFLIIGGNLGDREKNLSTATAFVAGQAGVIKKKSAIYETAPWGVAGQPNYYNQVVEILTELTAEELMTSLLAIEEKMGRIRNEKYGPRTIDLDILFFNNEISNTETLILPHSRLHERKFVLEPLNEIAPEFMHPIFNKPVHQLLHECNDNGAVTKL